VFGGIKYIKYFDVYIIPARCFYWKYRIYSLNWRLLDASDARKRPIANGCSRLWMSYRSARCETFSMYSSYINVFDVNFKSAPTLNCLFLVKKPDQSTSYCWWPIEGCCYAILRIMSNTEGSASKGWFASILILL
jgi:hypothetical protein